MAAEARREARRKRILQNSDSRLKRILDSKTSEAAIHDESTALLYGSSNLGKTFITPSETPEDDKSSLQEIQTESKENADKTKPNDKISTPARDLCHETVQSLRERTKDPQKDEEIKGNIDGSTSRKTTVKQERFNLGSLGTWLRIVLNVSLALCLVTLSTKYKIQQVCVLI